MNKTAIVNANSFGKYFPRYIKELQEQVGPTERFKFPIDIAGKDLADKLKGYSFIVVGTEPQLDDVFFQNVNGLQLVVYSGRYHLFAYEFNGYE